MTAACATPGCTNAGQPIPVGDLTYTDDDGQTVSMDVMCGVCGQLIDDLTPAPTEQPEQPEQPRDDTAI